MMASKEGYVKRVCIEVKWFTAHKIRACYKTIAITRCICSVILDHCMHLGPNVELSAYDDRNLIVVAFLRCTVAKSCVPALVNYGENNWMKPSPHF